MHVGVPVWLLGHLNESGSEIVWREGKKEISSCWGSVQGD